MTAGKKFKVFLLAFFWVCTLMLGLGSAFVLKALYQLFVGLPSYLTAPTEMPVSSLFHYPWPDPVPDPINYTFTLAGWLAMVVGVLLISKAVSRKFGNRIHKAFKSWGCLTFIGAFVLCELRSMLVDPSHAAWNSLALLLSVSLYSVFSQVFSQSDGSQQIAESES
jgi:hypothetical protein